MLAYGYFEGEQAEHCFMAADLLGDLPQSGCQVFVNSLEDRAINKQKFTVEGRATVLDVIEAIDKEEALNYFMSSILTWT